MKQFFKKGATLSLLFNLLFLSIKCQTTFNQRIDYYNQPNASNCVLIENDTILIGTRTADSLTASVNEISIIKMDYNGIVHSKKAFVRNGYNFDIGGNILKYNSEYYIPGNVGDFSGNIFGALYEFNSNLDTVRNIIKGDTAFYTYYSYLLKKDDNLYIFGASDSACGASSFGYKFFLKKMDTLGNIIWQKHYSTTCLYRNQKNIDTTFGGGFVLCGYERTGFGTGNTLVIKTDSIGNQLWSKNYGFENTPYPSIVSTKTCGYLIATNQIDSIYLSSFFWSSMKLYRIDENGDTLWTKKIGNKNMAFSPTSIKQLSNYDYIISGSNGVSHNDISGSVVSDQLQGFLCRIDSSGNVKWFKNYTGNYLNDSSAQNYLYDVAPTNDGGFVAVGFVAPTDGSTQDSWVIKVDSMGCLNPGCNSSLGVTTIHLDEPKFEIYPNPTTDFIDIATDYKNCWFTIFDVTGKLVLKEKIIQNKTRINLSNYSNGLYFIQLQTENKMRVKKFVKQ
jgi:hypothetical protein